MSVTILFLSLPCETQCQHELVRVVIRKSHSSFEELRLWENWTEERWGG